MIQTLEDILRPNGEGVVILDNVANVLNASVFAQEIFARADGLINRAGKLCFSDKDAHRQVLSRLATGCEPANGKPIFVRRETGKSPYKVKIALFQDEWLHKDQPKPHSLLLVSETNRKLDFPIWVFKDYYGLTPSELTLAEAIFGDMPLRDYAEFRGIKITTVRWTLDNVFSKTYTHSQTELKSLGIKFAI